MTQSVELEQQWNLHATSLDGGRMGETDHLKVAVGTPAIEFIEYASCALKGTVGSLGK